MDHYDLVGITRFERMGPHTLRLEFDDGAIQTIDFSPILYGELFSPLRDPEFFARVRLDPDFKTLVWPNDADFDPCTLRHWPEELPYLLEAVERWKQADLTNSKIA
jgi:uncharacterized protein DUF2442